MRGEGWVCGKSSDFCDEDSGASWEHFSASPLWPPQEIMPALLDPVLPAASEVTGQAL